MKLRLQIRKNSSSVYEGFLDATDAESFGGSWTDVWIALCRQSAAAAPGIGALYERLNDSVLDQLNGVEISLAKT